jgi:hypothetical protein
VSTTVRLVTLAVLAAIALGLFLPAVEGGPGISDTAVYQRYGERMAAGDLPYRDFRVEYPPGALVPFVLPALVTAGRRGYDNVFAAQMIAALAASSVLIVLSLRRIGASTRRVASGVGAFLLGVALLGPFVLTRFDLLAGALVLAAVCAVVHRRERLGAVLLGAAIATKIYPAVLLPLFVSRIWKRDGRRAALASLGLTLAAAFVIYLPFLVLSPDGVLRSVWRQLGRPLQIESLGSGILLALHHAADMPLGWASSSGSQNLAGTVAAVASSVTTRAGAAAQLLAGIRYARGATADDSRLTRYVAAAVVAFVAFGKVLSPQFLVWALGVVVLVVGTRGTVATVLLLVACALTRLWFPRTYWELVKQFDPTASWLVLVRDLVLVAVFATLVGRLATFDRN